MNYKITTTKALGSIAVLAVLFAAFMAMAPAQAHAQTYGYGYSYNYTRGGTMYTYPTAHQVVYQQPTYVQPTYVQPTYVQPTYIQPTYVQPTYTYPSLSVTCYAQTTSVPTGSSVEWIASAIGGNSTYSYTWSGTDGLTGYGSYIYDTYYYSGLKTAMVTVYSGGQSQSVNCSNSVSVYDMYAYQQPVYQQPVTYVQPTIAYNQPVNANLDIGCYADPTTAVANQPVTWSAEATGGQSPYTYSWSGSDGLSGSGSSITKYYSTSGDKSALVTVTSADGKTGTHACSNSLAVRNTSSQYAYAPRPAASQTTTQTTTTTTQPGQQQQATVTNTGQSAAAAFSLSGIPWGWVAVLVILILFATVIYLLFNRPKI